MAAKPERYVVPYDDMGASPWPYVWFEGITEYIGEHGEWRGDPVPYKEAMTWPQAVREVDRQLAAEAKRIREQRAAWRDATPAKARRHG